MSEDTRLKFKNWLVENDEFPANEEEPTEYDPPDEAEMDRIRKTPLRCDSPPDLRGDRYRFRMPMGETENYVIHFGAIIGLKSALGSLNKKCMDLMREKKCGELYRLLQYVRHNNNSIIRKQLANFYLSQ